MACHFPKAGDIKEFWKNLRSGTDAVTEVPPDRWNAGEHYQPGEYQEGKSISKWGGFIHDIDQFDPEYFNISETLAPMIDPLQRQWLEVSAEALADAGYQKRISGAAVSAFLPVQGQVRFIRNSNICKKMRLLARGKILLPHTWRTFITLQGPTWS